jgi:uncharacterized protein (TIGR03083 family)
VSFPSIPIAPVVDALAGEWASIGALIDDLAPGDWDRPSPLPGWTVRDNLSHVIGTEAMLLGEAAPPPAGDRDQLPHVRNAIAEMNERWVQALRTAPPEVMRARFAQVSARRLDALGAMSQADFDAPSWTPVGENNYGRFMEIRLYDCWMHEQDMRDGAGRPGNEEGPAAERSVDEAVGALGYLIGKRAGAPEGSLVHLELTGPVQRSLYVEVAGRARVVADPDRPPTVTLSLSSNLFSRLTGGRTDAAAHASEIAMSGDTVLGRRVAEHLAFTM